MSEGLGVSLGVAPKPNVNMASFILQSARIIDMKAELHLGKWLYSYTQKGVHQVTLTMCPPPAPNLTMAADAPDSLYISCTRCTTLLMKLYIS